MVSKEAGKIKKSVKFFGNYYSEYQKQTCLLFIGHKSLEIQARLRKLLNLPKYELEADFTDCSGKSWQVSGIQVIWMKEPRWTTLIHEVLHMSISMLTYSGIADFNQRDTEEMLCLTQEYWARRLWNDIEPTAQEYKKSLPTGRQ